MKNKILALVATTGLAAGAAVATAQELSVNTSFGFESEYVFRGVQLATESFQPSIDLAYGDFYASVWSNQPIEDDSANEIDYTAGYLFSVNEGIVADLGAIVYHYPDTMGDNETLEGYVGFAFNNIPFATPSIYVYHDFDLETVTGEGSLARSFTIDETKAVEVAGYVGYVDEEGGTEYYYYGASADLVYQFSENAAAKLGVRVSENDDNRGPRDNNLWGGFSFSAGF